MTIIWDDQKPEDYPFQTDFSYRANQLTKKRWFTYNIAGGTIIGLIMALIVFLMPSTYLTELTRCLIAGVIGVWPLKFMEIRSERSTKVGTAAMAVVFGVGILAYAISILVGGQ